MLASHFVQLIGHYSYEIKNHYNDSAPLRKELHVLLSIRSIKITFVKINKKILVEFTVNLTKFIKQFSINSQRKKKKTY